VTERFSEKFLKKLFRNTDNWTDVEDGMKRLDRLTQEEAEMAAAQVLKATHAVDDAGRVRGVADIALSVDRRVAGVIDGAQYNFNQSSNTYLTPNVHRCTTSSRWRRSDGTFVVSELHSCCTCRLNYRHRESVTTGSS